MQLGIRFNQCLEKETHPILVENGTHSECPGRCLPGRPSDGSGTTPLRAPRRASFHSQNPDSLKALKIETELIFSCLSLILSYESNSGHKSITDILIKRFGM